MSITALDRDQLVIDHLPLARRLAWRHPAPQPSDQEDVVAVAQVALVEAAGRFDSERGVKFATFATPRIRGAIADHRRAQDPLSKAQRQSANHLERSRRAFSAREGRRPREAELAAEAHIDPARMRGVLAAAQLASATVSLQQAYDSESAAPDPIGAALRDPRAEHEFTAVLQRQELGAALARLRPRERYVLRRRYWDAQTLRQIGAELGVSESRASQIETGALARMHVCMLASAA